MNGSETNKGKGFKPWQSGNPNWTPRKLFSTVNIELRAKWITPITRGHLLEAYALIFNSTEEELAILSVDKNMPYVLRLIIGELNNDKTRSNALSDYRDYMFGKAKETLEVAESPYTAILKKIRGWKRDDSV